jgi:F-type H+-transporting ATPase subunit gamma
VNRTVVRWIEQQKAEGRGVEICCSGRRGYSFFRNRSTIRRFYEEAATRPAYDIACRIGHDLRSDFLRGIADEVYLAHNKPHGLGSQMPVIERLLPLDPATLDALAREEGGATGDCLFEPAPADLLGALVPQMINLKVYSVMLSSASGEHSARMRAMDQATSNADSLIEKLTVRRNRARQAQITTELTEIVAGAEALK